jgi:oxygen-independent coproporphyrinogen-3 oxidase
MHRRGELVLPDEDTAAALYEATAEEAAHYGLQPYEVSNYALPGSESRHNLAYWRYRDYAGVGPGAHGRITLSPPHIMATRRHRAPEPWADLVEREGHAMVEEIPLQQTERAREMLLMGLRLTEGIDPTRFAERTGTSLQAALEPSVLRQALDEGYLAWRGERLVATPAGRMRLNALLAAIVR